MLWSKNYHVNFKIGNELEFGNFIKELNKAIKVTNKLREKRRRCLTE
jgi:hypothetical protein